MKLKTLTALMAVTVLFAETQDRKKPANGPTPPPLNQPGNVHPGPIPPITPPPIPSEKVEGNGSRTQEKKETRKKPEITPKKQK
ncbi:MAG: hypothetical protein WKF37_21960 [Bryobacteraceae bacterium]